MKSTQVKQLVYFEDILVTSLPLLSEIFMFTTFCATVDNCTSDLQYLGPFYYYFGHNGHPQRDIAMELEDLVVLPNLKSPIIIGGIIKPTGRVFNLEDYVFLGARYAAPTRSYAAQHPKIGTTKHRCPG